MFDKLKSKIFPCEKIVAGLLDDHAQSMKNNQDAHKKLLTVCSVFNPKDSADRSKDCLFQNVRCLMYRC